MLLLSNTAISPLLPRLGFASLGSRIATTPTAVLSAEPVMAAADQVTSLLAFADQADNLAGPLFASSLFPYLIFLYFVRQDCNGLSPVAKAGFTSLLGFVFMTIVTSIVAVKSYGTTLANVDYLHSGAEQLLSFTNIIDVIGLKLSLDGFTSGAVSQPAAPPPSGDTSSPFVSSELPVLGIAAGAAILTTSVTFAACGGSLAEHTAYLGGVGNLPDELVGFLSEPANALSIPTWVIHVSSLLEWLVAMGLVWRIGLATGNPRWKGMTWAMIPSHASGVAACTYHVFYNSPDLQFVVLLQAALTLLGNVTLAFAAYRLAASNGWQLPFLASEVADGTADGTAVVSATEPPVPVDSSTGGVLGLATVLAWSVLGSYVLKYGGAAMPITQQAPALGALFLILGPTAFNVWKWNERSKEEGDFKGLI